METLDKQIKFLIEEHWLEKVESSLLTWKLVWMLKQTSLWKLEKAFNSTDDKEIKETFKDVIKIKANSL